MDHDVPLYVLYVIEFRKASVAHFSIVGNSSCANLPCRQMAPCKTYLPHFHTAFATTRRMPRGRMFVTAEDYTLNRTVV